MSRLLRQVAAEQDASLSKQEAELRAVGERLRAAGPAAISSGARVSPSGARSRWFAALVAAALLVSLALGTRSLWRVRPVTLVAGGADALPGALIEAATDEIACRFSDGSTLLVRERARVRLVATRPRGATLVLERGRASVFVEPREGTDYRFEAGPYAVRVTGTRFDLGWDPASERFELAMQSGAVELRGPGLGDGRTVVAGQSIVLGPDRRAAADVLPQAVASAPPPERAPEAPPPPPDPDPSVVRPPAAGSGVASGGSSAAKEDAGPTWRELARQGKFKDAFKLLQASGIDAEIGRAPAGDLLALADVARFGGQPAAATRALESLRKRFPKTPESAQAAFHFGRGAFSGGSYGSAATWFETYLAEAPGGAYAREALGRLLECHKNAGASGKALAVAKQYLAAYPKGPHAELARSVTGAPAP